MTQALYADMNKGKKKTKLNKDITRKHECGCKNPQQNISKLNLTMYKKIYMQLGMMVHYNSSTQESETGGITSSR
jgi:hypothetical protein